MNITIIGANGKQGRLLTQAALHRNHKVTAVVRGDFNAAAEVKVIKKDLFKLVYEDVKEADVIIDAFATWQPETLPLHQTSLTFLADLVSGKPNRLLVVGGAGSLYLDASHTTRLMDSPNFPDMFKPLASSMGAALDELKKRNDVNWSYISPSANFDADGARTGQYRTGGEEVMVNAAGESMISYADYAIAMMDEAEQNTHPQQRFTVVSL